MTMIENLAYEDLKARQEGQSLLHAVDILRLDATQKLDADRKSDLGQFFTPDSVAYFLASLFECSAPTITLLDAGAGVGSLFSAYVAHVCQNVRPPEHIHIVAYEIDELLLEYL